MTGAIIAGRFELRPATAPPTQPHSVFSRTFEGEPDKPFSALTQAESFLAERGFSFGPGCAASRKAGILFGSDWVIAKWRNLTPLERHRCHGVIEGDRRNGPVTVSIFFSAPALALAAVVSPETAEAITSVWEGQR
jgi:hypothetical protein